MLYILASIFILFAHAPSGCTGRVDLKPCYQDGRLTNGCSIPWGIDFPYKEFFNLACERHDVCYVCGNGHQIKRETCDQSFYNNMVYLCNMKEISKSIVTSSYGVGYSWQRFWREVKGSWLVGSGMFKWLDLKTGSLKHCLNAAKIYHDAVSYFAMKEFMETSRPDCLLPCAKYMVNQNNTLSDV